jgi:hypothetical protein
VVYPGIGCDFDAVVAPRPVLCCRQQQCAYTFSALAFRYEPAFHEPDWVLRIAPISVGSQARFEKSYELSADATKTTSGMVPFFFSVTNEVSSTAC